MRTSIDLDEDLKKEMDHALSLTGEKQATVIRLALRMGLPLVLNRFQAPRPEGYFADCYRKADRSLDRQAHAAALRQKPRR